MERTLLFGWGRAHPEAVHADMPAETTVGDLVRACADATGASLEGDLVILRASPAGRMALLDPEAAVGALGLRSGDAVTVRSASAHGVASAPCGEAPAVAELVAVGGPQCGSRWPLVSGVNVVGRDATGGLNVGGGGRDRVVVLDVSAGVEVTLTRGAGAVRVDGEIVGAGENALAPGAWIGAGADVLTVRAMPARRSASPHDGGTQRPPRVGKPVGPAPIEIPDPPAPPPRSTLPVGIVLAPALFAVVVALVTRNPVYLLFGALAPVLGAWRLVADRRNGRRSHRVALRRHADELRRAQTELAAAQASVLRARRAAMPDPAALVDRAVLDRATVWERRVGDPDHLDVRVGTGELPTLLVVRPAGAAPSSDSGVPACVALAGGAVLGIAGGPRERARLARWVALQVAVLHSPEDVALAVVGDDAAGTWGWARLLPHHLEPAGIAAHAAAHRDGATSRHLVVVVDGGVAGPAAAALAALTGPGVSLVWCAPSRERLPGACTHVVVADTAASARLSVAADPAGAAEIVPDGVGPDGCLVAARALARRADQGAGANRTWGTVGFVDALAQMIGIEAIDPPTVASLWAESTSERLPCLIGRGRSGLVSVDLARDGPHALVVGTTGSGKSELFTTMLASLAVAVGPRRLAFLLVDFKGGAAFDRLAALPHTAGVVTDLDGDLSRRVLVSLEAELRRRMRILRDLGVADVVECERTTPEAAPPRLAVVVDEFAALAREVPGFVDGLVDVARRGRSLGVHLLVGTQQPDAHTAKLADNTNLRMCLRVQDAGVSREVVGTAGAARFPRDARGRAIVARGHGDCVEVQTAWAGRNAATADAVRVRVIGDGAETAADGPGPAGRTELDEVVAAVVAAWRASGGRPHPHNIWVPPPPARVDLDTLPAGTPTAPVVGIADEPDRQRLAPMRLDLAAWGSVLVSGRSGSGRTTLLRTVARAAARVGGTAIYALDCADGGLADLADMPQCAAVVTCAEPERVDRLFAVLRDEVAWRTSARGRRTPAIVLLLDGFGTFAATFEDWTGGHVAALRRLCEDGRSLRIHAVVAGDPTSVPGRVRDAFGAVVELGSPGAAAGPEGARWRVATGGAVDGTGDVSQAVVRMPPIEALPADVARAAVVGDGAGPVLGVAGDTMNAVTCDLAGVPMFLVAGPMRSGRSTALATIVQGIVQIHPTAQAVLLAPRRGVLTGLNCWSDVAVGPDACADAAARVADEVRRRAGTGSAQGEGPRLVVVVDDAEMLTDGPAAAALEVVARRCWDADVWLLAAVESHAAARSFGWLVQMRVCRHGIVLQADADTDSEVFRVRLPRRRGYATTPGRGELVAGGAVRLVQVAR